MPEHKMVALGAAEVGKSAIAVRFLQGTFMEKYDPTVEDSYRKNVQIENVHYVVEILDTAGSELWTAMKDLYMKDGQGFILVYSITDRESFEYLKKVRNDIEEVTGSSNYPSIVVGNKADLEEKRQVKTDEAKMWAESFEDCSFMEISAKMTNNIEDIFLQLLQQILRAEQRKIKEAQALEANPPPEPEQVPEAEAAAPTGKKDKSKKDKDCVIS